MTQSAGRGRPDDNTRFPLEDGVCYLVRGKTAEPCYRLAKAWDEAGIPVLCVSRTHPDRLRIRFGLENAETWWITGAPGDGHFDPTAIGTLANGIESFIDDHPDACLVVLDGVEYVSVHVGFEKTLLFVERLNEYVMPRRATMLVPVDPACFQPTEFARLDRFTGSLTEEELRQMVGSSEPE